MERRLAAILAADVVGYSRQMGADEAGTMARLRVVRTQVIEPLLAEHRGRLFKTMGDAFLAESSSAVQAVTCARAIQERMAERNAPAPEGERLELRIGLHSGDVLVEGDDLYGDGVNVAARLEALAEPGGICISARVREDAAGKLSLEVEDLGEPELKNIAQPIRVYRVRLGALERPALPLPEKPSLVVLPFQNMSGDPEQEYFADGVVEDITTALSRTGWLFVIARNSAFTFKGRAVDVRQVGREVGVRYVLEGSVRRAGGRVRITGQLIEAATGGHVWADRFEGDLADIFALQDKITESVVGAIEPSLRRAEIARATAKPTGNLDAYDLYLRALPHYYGQTRADTDAAVALLRRALEIDPSYVRAKGLLAPVFSWRDSYAWDEPGEREAAIKIARDTLAMGAEDPEALRFGAVALSYLAGDYPAAFTALNRALRLHPNSAHALMSLGYVHNQSNDPEPAIDYFERAMRLSPLDPEIGWMFGGLGITHLMAGRDTQALTMLQRAVQEMPNLVWGYRFQIHALVRLGRLDEARVVARRLLEISPNNRATNSAPHMFNPKFNEERLQALVAAGVPE